MQHINLSLVDLVNLTPTLSPICLTVDVEEYFHAANLSTICTVRTWRSLPSTIERNTHELLDIFDVNNSKGTFFVLAYSAKRYPALVKEIQKRGHEISSHGYAHKIAYLQSPKQFLRDIVRSKKILEDITGVGVRGYRAPNFSITDKNLWAYDKIIEAGYSYDSSLNPVHHHRYGNPKRSTIPELIENNEGKLWVLPLTALHLAPTKIRFPIAGGAYWRLFPLPLIKWAIKKKLTNSKESTFPPICYVHPWEIDSQQPYFASAPATKKFRHYYGISGFKNKLNEILKYFRSNTVEDNYFKDASTLATLPRTSSAPSVGHHVPRS